MSALPGLADAFDPNPYLEACPAWDVPPAPSSISSPVRTSVPVLMVLGQFDPFSPPDVARELSRSLVRSYLLEVPAVTHNPLLNSGCQIGIRDRWIEQPTSPPTGTACLRQRTLRVG
jgi:pimeloyl-ACP methyl ester carboxylesterase